jgi:hypothetical protein
MVSFAKIPFAREINSIRIVFHRSCEVPNASCSASSLSFLVAFAVLSNPDRGCYWKIWSYGSNSPSSSGSISAETLRGRKILLIAIRRFWSRWKQSLIVVSPDTAVRWHRAGFALYWRALSRARRVVGRKRISKAARDLIFRMTTDNPSWGAPRIHGERLMLGFQVSERTVSRWMRRATRAPEPPTQSKSKANLIRAEVLWASPSS